MNLKTIVAAGAVLVSMMPACKSKEYQTCLGQVDTYERAKIDCLAKTDAKERDACTNQNEVRKMTRHDCDEAFH